MMIFFSNKQKREGTLILAGEKAQKETFAIADDEIDIRLIQQQISNVLKRVSPNNSDSKSGSPKKENEPPPL